MIRRIIGELNSSDIVVHGGCWKGADRMASDRIRELRDAGVKHIVERQYLTDWEADGLSGGPRRNERMIKAEMPIDVAHAFPVGESRGTWDCIRRLTGKVDLYIWTKTENGWQSEFRRKVETT